MKKVIYVLVCFSIFISVVTVFGQENVVEDWRKWELKHDKKNIRRSDKMYTDTSESFITIPSDYSHIRDFDVARTPPTIDFGIVQGYEPWFLPITYQIDSRKGGLWEGYGDVTKGPDECFYFSIGDHRSYNGNAYIIRYDPEAKIHEIIVRLIDYFMDLLF